jgi:serine phosphatase RsbU (regulator of sigma subunit)
MNLYSHKKLPMPGGFSLRRLLLLTVIWTLVLSPLSSQTPRIDSLKKLVLSYPAKDTTRANLLIALCKAYATEINDKEKLKELVPELFALSHKTAYKKGTAYSYLYMGLISMGKSDYVTSLEHYDQALKLMMEINDKNGIGTCYIYIGNTKNNQGKFSEAIDYKLKAVKIKEELGDQQGLANAYNSIGVSCKQIGKIAEALNYYFKALKIREAINDRQGISSTYLNIGIAMYEQGNVSGSLDYQEKSLKIKQELGDKEGAAIIYSNMSNVYIEQKRYKEALSYSFKSMQIAEEIEDKQIVNNCYLNIANIFYEQKKLKESLPYYLKAVKTSMELEDKAGVIVGYNSLGNCYEGMNRYEEAMNVYLRALSISKEINYKIGIRDACLNLASVNEKLHNCDQALFYTKAYGHIKDSLLNEESMKQSAELNTRYQTEKKENEILLLTKEQQLKDKTLNEQRLIRLGLMIGLGLLLILSFLLYNRYRYKQKANLLLQRQKEQIHYKNQQITDSIDYAKNIQEAILPAKEKLLAFFPEHFILYKPKAIVSGDFYWVGKKDNKIICAVADCTGHGIPGAFMSLLGHNILENILQRNTAHNPAAILSALNEEIVARFSEGGKETVKHGMDIAIISLDKEKNALQYAGARNALYLIRDNKLTEIKADRQSTGIVSRNNKEITYTNNTLELKNGDMFYLFSDGFPDQKGGPDKKKFYYQPFKELLVSIHKLPVDIQKQKLDETIMAWTGDEEQIDDILIMGIKHQA